MEKTMYKNTTESALTQGGVDQLEVLLHWFWNNSGLADVTPVLMDAIDGYVRMYTTNPHGMQEPGNFIHAVSEILQLKEQLVGIMDEEKPWNWVEAPKGWALPSKP